MTGATVRYVVANLICWVLLLAGAVGGAVALGWPTGAVLAVGGVGFLVFGRLVERLAPGTRLLDGLGWGDRRPDRTR